MGRPACICWDLLGLRVIFKGNALDHPRKPFDIQYIYIYAYEFKLFFCSWGGVQF